MVENEVKSALTRLRQRKLVQWSLAYLAAAWVAFEVVAELTDTFSWSVLVPRLVFVALAAGFAVTLVVAWYHGERGHQRVLATEVLVLTAVLALATVGVVRTWHSEPSAETETASATNQASVDPMRRLDAASASVAVLPFENLSGLAEDAHFVDGVSEEILNVLAQVPGVRVAARSSAWSFKDSSPQVPDVAKALGVAHVLEGTIRRSGDRVRVTAQLNDRTGFQVWSETFERHLTPENAFEIEDGIVTAVASALDLRVREQSMADRTRTGDPQAYELALRGLQELNRGGETHLREAVRLYEAAIQHDPEYASAYLGVGVAHGHMAEVYVPPLPAYELTLESVERALALTPRWGPAVALRALTRLSLWQTKGVLDQIELALSLNPSDPFAYFALTFFELWRGEPERAAGALDAARRIDPLNPLWPEAEAWIYTSMGRWEAAVEAEEAVQRLAPDFVFAGAWAGVAQAALGKDEEAVALFENEERVSSRPSIPYVIYLANEERVDEARAKLELLERQVESGETYVLPAWIAQGWEATGDRERTLAWIERGMQPGAGTSALMWVSFRHSDVVSLDDFRTLAKRYGAPEPPGGWQ